MLPHPMAYPTNQSEETITGMTPVGSPPTSSWTPPHSPSRPPEARSTTIANTSVHAHGLRHTHAAELAHEGKPMNLIQAQLGHASLAVTST